MKIEFDDIKEISDVLNLPFKMVEGVLDQLIRKEEAELLRKKLWKHNLLNC